MVYSAIFGFNPSKGARSPIIWNQLYRGLGIEGRMIAVDCETEEDFKQQFKAFVISLRPMTADDMRMVNKQTIALVEAKPGDTYAKLARGVPIRRNAEETLRLINGHYPRGEPRAGDRIKVVR